MVVSEIPNFTLTNQQGDAVNFYEALDNTAKGMIIFVYPKANTPGCTKQACGFRDHYDDIKGRGYGVVGISRDKPTAQATWKKSKNLPYDLLYDEDGQVLKDLGCLSGNATSRSVFVVDKESRALVLERVKISPEESVAAAMKVINGETSASEHDEASDEGSHPEAEEPKVTKPSAKPKAKAKAKAAANRPPMEKKSGEEDGKKMPATRRATNKRSASVEAPAAEKKKATTAAVGRPAGKKTSVKRSEPSGGVDEVDGSPKGTKRARKVAPTTEDGVSVTGVTGGRSTRARTSSQPAAAGRPRAVGRPASKTSTKEKATTPKDAKEETKVKSGKASGATAGRSATPTKRAKK